MHCLWLLSLFCSIVCLTFSASEFPIELSISQHRKFFPYEISTFTQYVNVEIKTGENLKEQTLPAQELFLILDTSGSMGSDKKLIDAKFAIENIIKNMNKNDRLHLVVYNSDSSIIFEDENNQELMLKKLKSIYPGGSTNLMAGFDQTKILLKKYSKRPTVKRIFLFSDGQINEGVTDHTLLLNEVTSMKKTYEITVCSFGIGLDFDENLMTNIADYGSGDYFFIRGSETMNKVIQIAFKTFQTLMGTNAYLKITTKNNAQIVDTYGYEHLKNDEDQTIPIGDIRYNDKMNILLQTEISISEKLLDQNDIDYMIIELWMTDIQDQTSKLISTERVLFSLSKNADELKDLNQLIEYLVQLQIVQRREKEVTQLLKEQRKDEAMAMKKVLSDKVDQILMSSSKIVTTGLNEANTKEYLQRQAETIKRRNLYLQERAVDGADELELALQNEHYSKLNSRYKETFDEL